MAKVRLNDKQIALCRGLGVAPEEYAEALGREVDYQVAKHPDLSPEEAARELGVEWQGEEEADDDRDREARGG